MERLHQAYRQVALTVTAGAYATGQCVGGLKTINSNLLLHLSKTGELRQVILSDKAKQSLDCDILFFHTNPSATTFTDNATLDVDDADISKIAAVVPVRNHYTFNDNSVSSSGPTALPIRSEIANGSGSTIYFTVVARGSATFASTSDLSVGLYAYGD